jgi:hypothetical protein
MLPYEVALDPCTTVLGTALASITGPPTSGSFGPSTVDDGTRLLTGHGIMKSSPSIRFRLGSVA